MASFASPPKTQPGASAPVFSPIPGERRKRSATEAVVGLFLVAAIAIVAALAGDLLYDAVHRQIVRPKVLRAWPAARDAVAARLKQDRPPQFGAVWSTHSGLFCGLVNGWGSFGGLIGLTPFAVERGRAVFLADAGPLAFAPYWRRCLADPWIMILDGPMTTGSCATTIGPAACLMDNS